MANLELKKFDMKSINFKIIMLCKPIAVKNILIINITNT